MPFGAMEARKEDMCGGCRFSGVRAGRCALALSRGSAHEHATRNNKSAQIEANEARRSNGTNNNKNKRIIIIKQVFARRV